MTTYSSASFGIQFSILEQKSKLAFWSTRTCWWLINNLIGDAVDGTNGEESREAEDATVPADAAATTPVVTENGANDAEHHVNGNGKANENAEADCKFD